LVSLSNNSNNHNSSPADSSARPLLSVSNRNNNSNPARRPLSEASALPSPVLVPPARVLLVNPHRARALLVNRLSKRVPLAFRLVNNSRLNSSNSRQPVAVYLVAEVLERARRPLVVVSLVSSNSNPSSNNNRPLLVVFSAARRRSQEGSLEVEHPPEPALQEDSVSGFRAVFVALS
jgi:hypothetical protein